MLQSTATSTNLSRLTNPSPSISPLSLQGIPLSLDLVFAGPVYALIQLGGGRYLWVWPTCPSNATMSTLVN